MEYTESTFGTAGAAEDLEVMRQMSCILALTLGSCSFKITSGASMYCDSASSLNFFAELHVMIV